MNVTQIAVARDNNVLYIIIDGVVRKSTNGGQHFINLSLPAVFAKPPRMIAVAPDSSDTIMVVDSHPGGNHIWVSTNGGNAWTDIGNPKNGINAVITDIAISPAMGSQGRHYFATTADNRPGVTTRGDVMMKVGSLWNGIGGVSTTHDYMAIHVSPEYLADQSVCVVGVTPKDGIDYQVINYGAKSVATNVRFLGPGTKDYSEPAAPDAIIRADIVVGIDAVSMDVRNKVAFISITSSMLNRTDGLYRVTDQFFERISVYPNDVGLRIRSIDFDGEGLLAGEYETTNVWVSSNPLTPTPSFDKVNPPAGEREAVVGIKNPNCFVGTSGKKSGGFFILQ
jgi:hypothetical protein